MLSRFYLIPERSGRTFIELTRDKNSIRTVICLSVFKTSSKKCMFIPTLFTIIPCKFCLNRLRFTCTFFPMKRNGSQFLLEHSSYITFQLTS